MLYSEFQAQILREMGEYDETPMASYSLSVRYNTNEALRELSGMQPWSWWFLDWDFEVADDTAELSVPRWIQWPGRLTINDSKYDARSFERQYDYENQLSDNSVNSYGMGQTRRRAYYSTGTVSTTADSTTITGSGTTFTEDMVGKVIEPAGDGGSYLIVNMVSTTELTVDSAAVATEAGQTYEIDPRGTRTFRFVPAISVGGDATLYCYRKPDAITADTDEVDMPDEFIGYLHWIVRSKMLAFDEERSSMMKDAEDRASKYIRQMKAYSADELTTMKREIRAYAP